LCPKGRKKPDFHESVVLERGASGVKGTSANFIRDLILKGKKLKVGTYLSGKKSSGKSKNVLI